MYLFDVFIIIILRCYLFTASMHFGLGKKDFRRVGKKMKTIPSVRLHFRVRLLFGERRADSIAIYYLFCKPDRQNIKLFRADEPNLIANEAGSERQTLPPCFLPPP